MSLRERRKQATQAAIIEAAAALFARPQGYEGTTTREIAQAAGIAAGTLFNYAPTKRDVVVMLWTDRIGAAADEGWQAMAQQDEPVDALLALWRPIIAVYDADHELGQVFLTSVVFATVDEPALVEVTDGFIARLAGALMQWTPDGGMAAFNAFAAYYLVLTSLLAGRYPSTEVAFTLFESMLRTQQQGWSTRPGSSTGGG